MRSTWRFCGDSSARGSQCTVERQNEHMATVLVVEDERDIRDLLRRYLERAGHSVLTAATGAEGLAHIERGAPDLALLDLGLPDIDGLDLLARAHALGISVIALTARSTVEDRIRGLEHGADDYVTKPFSPQEVVLRVAAVLGRGNHAETTQRRSFGEGRLVIDETAHVAQASGGTVELTPTEWGLLTTLTSRPGRAFSRAELVNRVRGYEFAGYERTIDSHVKNLRKKIGDDEATMVETVLGVGYRFGLSADA